MNLDNISGLIDWLDEHDKELAEKLREDSELSWCWKETSAWLKIADVPEELYEKFVQALIETKDADYLYLHQRYCGHRDDVLQALIETKKAYYLYRHQLDCGHRDDVQKVLDELKTSATYKRFQVGNFN